MVIPGQFEPNIVLHATSHLHDDLAEVAVAPAEHLDLQHRSQSPAHLKEPDLEAFRPGPSGKTGWIRLIGDAA